MASKVKMGQRVGTKSDSGIMPEHLQKIGNRWRFRLSVPEALRPIIGKRELRISLKTADKREAKRLAHEEALKAEAAFDLARRTLAMQAGGAPQTELSNEEARSLAEQWLHSREQQDEIPESTDPADFREQLYLASHPDSVAQL
jgi:hypothetical protein